jgi:hypothetical protein
MCCVLQVYAKPCSLGAAVPDCVYNNPLALSPRAAPSALQCVRAFDTDAVGTCRIGPNKHGDACNQNAECASKNCIKELRTCKGIDEGEHCEPGLPDPCQPGHYCLPDSNGGSTGRCAKVISPASKCIYSEACDRGFYCAGPSLGERKCLPPFSVPDYSNTTIGPFMCASANAVLVYAQRSESESIYSCRPTNTSLVGLPCNPAVISPPGHECKCSFAGEYRLRTINALGIGSRSVVWKELHDCLITSTGITGELCEFDSADLEYVRYGSCSYYQCYPQYRRLVNVTGGRIFNPPLLQFETFANCELDAAKDYYKNVLTTECLTLPLLENWKCATDQGPMSLSVANTSGVIAFIFLAVTFLYIAHSYKFRKHNNEKFLFMK